MIPAFIQLAGQLQPAVLLDVVSFAGSLAFLELFEFHQVLIASPANYINVPIVSLGIREVRSTCMHGPPDFKVVFTQDIFIILSRVISANDKSPKSIIGYYCLKAFGGHSRRYFDFMSFPWIRLRINIIKPNIRVQKCPEFIPTALGFT